jgi:peptidoglycan/LPS O-acetylase OafA/YrhL
MVKRSQALDSIRGIAILLVLIWHYLPRIDAAPDWLLNSTVMFWSGVDLFFVLSGFLIGSILLRNVNAKNYFSTFYIRRAARIMPLYLLIIFMLVVVINWAPAFIEKTSRAHLPLWSYLTFTQNFLYATKDRFDDPLIDVTWSLAVEEQFYIILSLLVRNLSQKKLAIVAAGLVLLAPILRFYAPHFMVAYIYLPHRADSLMLGVLLALVWQWEKGKEFLHEHANVFRATGLLLFVVVAYLSYRRTWVGDPWGHLWLALFYCNCIVLALVKGDQAKRFDLFNNKILEWFGQRSYGIYLFHKPVQILVPLLITRYVTDSLSLRLGIPLYTLVLFVVAEISYRLFEKPIMVWGQRFKYDPVEKRQDEVTQPQPV